MPKKTAQKKRTITKITKKKQSCYLDYHAELIISLKDHNHAAAYLNAALKEYLKGDSESKQLFLLALKNVAEAQGSINTLAKRSKIRRESIYKMLSNQGNPYLQSFTSLIHAMGFNLQLY